MLVKQRSPAGVGVKQIGEKARSAQSLSQSIHPNTEESSLDGVGTKARGSKPMGGGSIGNERTLGFKVPQKTQV